MKLDDEMQKTLRAYRIAMVSPKKKVEVGPIPQTLGQAAFIPPEQWDENGPLLPFAKMVQEVCGELRGKKNRSCRATLVIWANAVYEDEPDTIEKQEEVLEELGVKDKFDVARKKYFGSGEVNGKTEDDCGTDLCKLAEIIGITCEGLPEDKQAQCKGVMVLYADGRISQERFEETLTGLGVEAKFKKARKEVLD